MSEGSLALSVSVANERLEIARLVQVVEDFGHAAGLVDDDTTDINLLLDEFVSNVIKYGYDDGLEHTIQVTLALEGRHLSIRIEDDGKAFNPLEAPVPDLDLPIEQRPIGGLGILIARTLADALEYRREGGRNVLTIRKTIR
jgi:anti-sigma regulatory factor (Ser/Thr protein kinase)